MADRDRIAAEQLDPGEVAQLNREAFEQLAIARPDELRIAVTKALEIAQDNVSYYADIARGVIPPDGRTSLEEVAELLDGRRRLVAELGERLEQLGAGQRSTSTASEGAALVEQFRALAVEAGEIPVAEVGEVLDRLREVRKRAQGTLTAGELELFWQQAGSDTALDGLSRARQHLYASRAQPGASFEDVWPRIADVDDLARLALGRSVDEDLDDFITRVPPITIDFAQRTAGESPGVESAVADSHELQGELDPVMLMGGLSDSDFDELADRDPVQLRDVLQRALALSREDLERLRGLRTQLTEPRLLAQNEEHITFRSQDVAQLEQQLAVLAQRGDWSGAEDADPMELIGLSDSEFEMLALNNDPNKLEAGLRKALELAEGELADLEEQQRSLEDQPDLLGDTDRDVRNRRLDVAGLQRQIEQLGIRTGRVDVEFARELEELGADLGAAWGRLGRLLDSRGSDLTDDFREQLQELQIPLRLTGDAAFEQASRFDPEPWVRLDAALRTPSLIVYQLDAGSLIRLAEQDVDGHLVPALESARSEFEAEHARLLAGRDEVPESDAERYHEDVEAVIGRWQTASRAIQIVTERQAELGITPASGPQPDATAGPNVEAPARRRLSDRPLAGSYEETLSAPGEPLGALVNFVQEAPLSAALALKGADLDLDGALTRELAQSEGDAERELAGLLNATREQFGFAAATAAGGESQGGQVKRAADRVRSVLRPGGSGADQRDTGARTQARQVLDAVSPTPVSEALRRPQASARARPASQAQQRDRQLRRGL